MIKNLLTFIVFVCITVNAQNEKTPIVHATETFTVAPTYDVVYAQGLSHENLNSESSNVMPLKLDIYTPDNNNKNRPVFLFIHGGGFRGGSKQQKQIIHWANYFTARGWVFISANYRLKKHNGTIPQKWIDFTSNLPKEQAPQFLAVYPAIRDAKAAMRWVVANAEKYHINTDYITVGGGSAGAITAIGIGVSEPEDYRDELSTEEDSTLESTNLDQEYQVKTIIDLWGSNVALRILNQMYGKQRFNSNMPPLLVAHGTLDPTVKFSDAENLKMVYEKYNVPLAFYPIEGKKHGAWGAKVNGKSLEELSFDFIVEQQNLKVK